MSARKNLGFTALRESVLSETAHYSERTISRMTTCAHTTKRQGTNDHA